MKMTVTTKTREVLEKEMKTIEREFFLKGFDKGITYTLKHTIYSERTLTKFDRYCKRMLKLKEEMDAVK